MEIEVDVTIQISGILAGPQSRDPSAGGKAGGSRAVLEQVVDVVDAVRRRGVAGGHDHGATGLEQYLPPADHQHGHTPGGRGIIYPFDAAA